MSATAIYYSPSESLTAYQDEIAQALAQITTLSESIIDLKEQRWTTMMLSIGRIVQPLVQVNFSNRPEQTDLTLGEKLFRATKNLFSKFGSTQTYQPSKYLYSMLSRNFGVVYNSIHNSRIKIAYHATEYLVDPNTYVPRLMIESSTSVLLDQIARDSLTIGSDTNRVLQTFLSGVTIRTSASL